MIAEYIFSLLTPAPKWARKMGYVREAIAIEARAKRCAKNWAQHLQKTRQAILKAVEQRENNRSLLIVGSGSCLDIPLQELSEIFERVILVDIVHPFKSSKHGLANVEQVCLDITNVIAEFYENQAVLPKVPPISTYQDFPDIDFVLSVNILSQLPVMPLQYADNDLAHSDAALYDFANNLISEHIRWLAGFKCPKTLICDLAWERLDLTGKVMESDYPLYETLMPESDEKWYWDVAPYKEIGAQFMRRNLVGYWANFKNAASDDIFAPSTIKTTESE